MCPNGGPRIVASTTVCVPKSSWHTRKCLAPPEIWRTEERCYLRGLGHHVCAFRINQDSTLRGAICLPSTVDLRAVTVFFPDSPFNHRTRSLFSVLVWCCMYGISIDCVIGGRSMSFGITDFSSSVMSACRNLKVHLFWSPKEDHEKEHIGETAMKQLCC